MRSMAHSSLAPHDPAALTTTFPVIRGWIEQKYSNSPGAVKVCENVSSVSSAADLNFPSFSRTECGLSSSLVQVTVVPGGTTNVGGVKLKLSIFTAVAAAATGTAASPAEGLCAAPARRSEITPPAPSNAAFVGNIAAPLTRQA